MDFIMFGSHNDETFIYLSWTLVLGPLERCIVDSYEL